MTAESSFEQIVQANQATVFRTLARLTGGRPGDGRLDDLAQDVFLRLYRALPSFRGEAMLSTYLYRITVNVAQNEWKRRQREQRHIVALGEDDTPWEERLPHPAPGAAEQLEHAEFARIVDEQLARLSVVERSVLVLYHQEERTYEQIALALALPINTVRTHLHRGRNKLREAILEQRPAARSRT